ncbi:MAG TPA: multidrug effflux MFS transporter [Caldimonas sp.]|jgi:DHA1 family bicyclomycin/chloramphenicol resistance-like MFS transporter|nr:multidrug effflux MFS transporter [Caldimonas sp.]HEX4235032.1 multidrug effflux MFS transporter [Caldimonas sp.]
MNPDARTIWQAPSWALAILLACLGMLGPFSIDTYLPAFTGIAKALGASPVEMQQTLSAYLFGFAVMNLFHGALSDSLGRRPVVLAGIAVFTLASIGCALSRHIGQLVVFRALQGMSAGAGVVVSRAVIRDMFPPADAQRVMSQVTIYFGVAPAVAPMVGGFLFVHIGWQSIFWLLSGVGVVLFALNWKLLPETLHEMHKQPFKVSNLMRGYWALASNPRFLMLALASGIPFNGMFLYVLSAPVFLGDILGLGPAQFFWFFVLTIAGIMSGAFASGQMAGRVKPSRQIRYGFVVMAGIGALNLVLNLVFAPTAWWALVPLALYGFGWAMMVPVVTLMVLDLVPERRGMASSLQAFVGSTANGFVAGVIAPLVMHSAVALAATSLGMMSVGVVSWLWVKPHLRPESPLPVAPG